MILTLLEMREYVYYPLLLGVSIFAFWKGGGPERALAALIWLAMIIPHRAFHWITGELDGHTHLDAFHVGMGGVVAVGAILVALHANRTYPLWFAGLQLISMQSHFARALTSDIAPIAYATMQIAPFYLMLVALGIGTWRHDRRLRRYGPYRDWRTPGWWSRTVDRNA